MELEYKAHSEGRFWEKQSARSIGTSLNLPLLLLEDDLVAMASGAQREGSLSLCSISTPLASGGPGDQPL